MYSKIIYEKMNLTGVCLLDFNFDHHFQYYHKDIYAD